MNAYAAFEGYLSEVLRKRLRKHPRLMGGKRSLEYERVYEASTKEEIIEAMIERGVRDLLFLPLPGLLQTMRDQLGFRSLVTDYDHAVHELSLVRNCLMHNRGMADSALSKRSASYQSGVPIVCDASTLASAVNNLRKFAYEIDKEFEVLA